VGRRGGTGSKPQSPNGWQRSSRRSANQLPRSTPCVAMASIPYCEHVGAKRQTGRSHGEIARW
jgi:hypothetical protein